jgi:hypothetical protein
MEKLEYLYNADGNVKWDIHFEKQSGIPSVTIRSSNSISRYNAQEN